MIEQLLNVDTFTGRQPNLRSCGNSVRSSVGVYGHVRDFINRLIRQRIINPDQHITAAVDNIFSSAALSTGLRVGSVRFTLEDLTRRRMMIIFKLYRLRAVRKKLLVI